MRTSPRVSSLAAAVRVPEMHDYSVFQQKSHLSWLDRLRSVKGLPVDPSFEIDDFSKTTQTLALSSTSSVNASEEQENVTTSGGVSAESTAAERKEDVKTKVDTMAAAADKLLVQSQRRKRAVSCVKEETQDWLDISNSALAVLFGVRDAKSSDMKHQRKQQKPRLFTMLPHLLKEDNLADWEFLSGDKKCGEICSKNDTVDVAEATACAEAAREKGDLAEKRKRKMKGTVSACASAKQKQKVSDVDGNAHHDNRCSQDKSVSLSGIDNKVASCNTQMLSNSGGVCRHPQPPNKKGLRRVHLSSSTSICKPSRRCASIKAQARKKGMQSVSQSPSGC